MINQSVKWFEDWRAKNLIPFWKFLTLLRLNANRVTGIRLLGGVLFPFIYPAYPKTALTIILIVSFSDWVDGGLARYQNTASDRGKFWDVMVDHLNYVIPIFAFIVHESFSASILAYQLLIVPVLFLFATLVESEGKPTDWLIKPYYKTIYFKIFGLLSLILYIYFGIDYIEEIVLALNVAMTLWTMYYVRVLLRRWKKPYETDSAK